MSEIDLMRTLSRLATCSGLTSAGHVFGDVRGLLDDERRWITVILTSKKYKMACRFYSYLCRR